MKLGQYIVKRLEQLHVTHIFGLPGDYNMQLLDHIEDSHKLQWVGCANELNASYAADGYARAANRPAVLVTTFGVGELSALNGVAGSYTEMLPVLHIVGMPPSAAQANHLWMHHTLGGNLYNAYYNMSQHISCDAALIGWSQRDLDNAPYHVDRVILTMLREKHPAYIGIPVDIIDMEVSGDMLDTPLVVPRPVVPAEKCEYVVNEVARDVEAAKRPLFLVDGCVQRHNVVKLVYDFLKKIGVPVVVAPMGKSLYPEDDEQFLGEYVGRGSAPSLEAIMEEVDLFVMLGGFKSDMNTGKFSYRTPTCHSIEIHSHSVQIGYAEISGIGFEEVLPALGERLAVHHDTYLRLTQELRARLPEKQTFPDESFISQDYLWHRIGQFLRPKDHVVCDMGTSCFGATRTRVPTGAHFYQQLLYGSIGWSVGAVLGVLYGAQVTDKGRVILFVGDGSLMLTMQEIATIMRYGLKPIIFVLNNDGYEIERKIHGPDRSYNNIPRLDYSLLLDFMSCTRDVRADIRSHESSHVRQEALRSHHAEVNVPEKHYHSVRTREELEKLFEDEKVQNADGIHLVELFLRRGDAPDLLNKFVNNI